MVFVCRTLHAHQVDDATVATDKRGTRKEVRPKAGERRDAFAKPIFMNDGKVKLPHGKYEAKANQQNMGVELHSPRSKDGRAEEVRIVALSMQLNCEGCRKRIRRDILRIPGVNSVEIDAFEDKVTVEGSFSMDDIVFANYLKEKLKRQLRVVTPPKKLDHGDDNKDEQPSENEDRKIKGGGGSDNNEDGDKEAKQEQEENKEMAKMEIFKDYTGYNDLVIVPNPWQQFHGRYYDRDDSYGQYHSDPYSHALQMLSDENPNACSLM